MNFVDFKPLNVQFVIESKEDADRLRALADALGDRVGDRRLRGAAAAKALVEAILKRPDLAAELLEIASAESPENEERPKGDSQAKAKKRAAGK